MSSLFEDKASSRRANYFKKGLKEEESRRKREDNLLDLRKINRETVLTNKRKGIKSTINNEFSVDNVNMIPELYKGILSDDANLQLDNTVKFRRLLSIERNPPIQEVIDSGAVPRLIQFLKREENPTLQFEAAWSLTNIASGTTQHTLTIIQAGAIPIFITLLRSPNSDVREQAVWALGNIAGDSTEFRNLVIESGGVMPLLSLCKSDSKITMLRNATWALSNLCRGKPQPNFEKIQPAYNILASLIHINDDEVVADAAWALSYLSDDTEKNNIKIQATIETGCVSKLVNILLSNVSNNIKTPCLRTIGNIVTGNDAQTQVVINCGAIEALSQLLENEKKNIRKETCWTISNITAGNAAQIETIIKHNSLIESVIDILKNASFDVKKEAAWAISNATSGGTESQIRYLVTKDVIPPLCDLLVCGDPRIILVVIEAIENILGVGLEDASNNVTGTNIYADKVERCGGLDKLETIQNHSNDKIYMRAVNIINEFFSEENEQDITDLKPKQTDSEFKFGDIGGFDGKKDDNKEFKF